MYFVGRQHEIARIESAIAANRNVIVRGKYGIGRTTLVREVARLNDRRWTVVYTNFSANGREICESILKQMHGRRTEELTARQVARAVAAYTPRRGRRTIIVLDDVAKLTEPKVKLMRILRTSPHLQFIAIVERFVSEDAVMRIRVALDPAVMVMLDYLDDESSVRFFEHYASEMATAWTESDVEMLARTMHGYPLEMKLLVNRMQRDRRGTGR